MSQEKRVFILGAGFSKPAGLPLATQLLPLLTEKLQGRSDMLHWLDAICQTLQWLDGVGSNNPFTLNIEQLFHYAVSLVETHKLCQQVSPAETCEPAPHEDVLFWLRILEEEVRNVIFEADEKANLAPILKWAYHVRSSDTVLTFNYDTLVERALDSLKKTWNHATDFDANNGLSVCKLHGSIDWIVTDGSKNFRELQMLSGNGSMRTWRATSRQQLQTWISGRDVQFLAPGEAWRSVGIAGLGTFKELHQIPGLGTVWYRAIRALHEADRVVVVGFSLSDFDALAQLQFAEVARIRNGAMPVRVIDPGITSEGEDRFRRVFRNVEFAKCRHEQFDWNDAKK